MWGAAFHPTPRGCKSLYLHRHGPVAKSVNAAVFKTASPGGDCRFDPDRGHHQFVPEAAESVQRNLD